MGWPAELGTAGALLSYCQVRISTMFPHRGEGVAGRLSIFLGREIEGKCCTGNAVPLTIFLGKGIRQNAYTYNSVLSSISQVKVELTSIRYTIPMIACAVHQSPPCPPGPRWYVRTDPLDTSRSAPNGMWVCSAVWSAQHTRLSYHVNPTDADIQCPSVAGSQDTGSATELIP